MKKMKFVDMKSTKSTSRGKKVDCTLQSLKFYWNGMHASNHFDKLDPSDV